MPVGEASAPERNHRVRFSRGGKTISVTDDSLDQRYRALSPGARSLSTDHPHIFYGIGAAEAILGAVLGAFFMTRSIVGATSQA